MNSKFKIQNSKLFCLLILVLFLSFTACLTGSMPNLDKPECAESRDVVKQFYSIHFSGEMKFSHESLKLKEKYLTTDLVKSLDNLETDDDVFTTNSSDFPRAFRLGACQAIEPTKTNVEVLLFWRDEKQTRQQSITVEAVKDSDKWLINKILR
jgi:hypothetical protein